MVEQSVVIFKPDSVIAGHAKAILAMIMEAGLKVVWMAPVLFTREQAANFYSEHSARGWFHEVIDFMTSGPSIVLILDGEDAINRWRELAGVTNPAEADTGTVRKLFGTDIMRNAVHGSAKRPDAIAEIAKVVEMFIRDDGSHVACWDAPGNPSDFRFV